MCHRHRVHNVHPVHQVRGTDRTESLILLPAASAAAERRPSDADLLARALQTPVAIIQGKVPDYTVALTAEYRDGQASQKAVLRVAHAADGQLALSLEAPALGFVLERRKEATRLVVPGRKVVIEGRGPFVPASDLDPGLLFSRIARASPITQTAAGVLQTAQPGAVALMMQMLLEVKRQPHADGRLVFVAGRKVGNGTLSIALSPDASSIEAIHWRAGTRQATVRVAVEKGARWPRANAPPDARVLEVPRAELERTIGRALPAAGKGRLVVRNGARVAMLQGEPYEVGYQHGKLLRREARRTTDAALYVVGLYYSLSERRWFLEVIRSAWRRLAPHIPRK